MIKPLLLLLAATLPCLLAQCSGKSGSGTDAGGAEAAIKDPSGFYTLRSDASITAPPEPARLIGDGTPLVVGYDGSKGDGLSYDLSYADSNGSVHPMGGGFFEKSADGSYTANIQVFNSNAHQRPGFIELKTVAGAGLNDAGAITGKNVSLGMYNVKFTVKE